MATVSPYIELKFLAEFILKSEPKNKTTFKAKAKKLSKLKVKHLNQRK